MLSNRVTKYDPSLSVEDVCRMQDDVRDTEQGQSKEETRKKAKRVAALKSRLVRKQKLELFATAQNAFCVALKESQDTEQLALTAANDILISFRNYCLENDMPLPNSVGEFETRLGDLSEQVAEKNRKQEEMLSAFNIRTWKPR
jgi:hypothetical protein